MSQNTMLIAKLVVAVTWFAAAAGFLYPPSSTFGQLGRLLFFLLLGIHTIECVVFYPTLKRTGRPIGMELARTLFYGVAHYSEAKALVEAGRSDSGDAPTAGE